MRRGFAPEPLWPSPSVRREPMQGTRVHGTGGAGFVGSRRAEQLGARNEVAVLDDLSAGSLRNLETVPRDVHVKKASILNRKALSTAMEGRDIVYHLAAKTSVPDSVAHPEAYWRTNVEGTLAVLKAVVDAKVRRVVFASSASVYGNSETNPKVETMRPAPASPYATSKMVGEFACEEIASLKGLETVVVRIFNAYGPRQDPTSPYASVISKFCAAMAADQGIEIYGDGDQTRDFLYVGDLTAALELAVGRPGAGPPVQLGSRSAASVNEVARLLSGIAGVSILTRT